MVRYLTIMQGIDKTILHDPEVNVPGMPPSAEDFESTDNIHLRLPYDSNCVARETQVHSKHHPATCFKYRPPGPGKNAYRFGMPRDLVPISKIDE